jgi:hypothetical protein
MNDLSLANTLEVDEHHGIEGVVDFVKEQTVQLVSG